MTSIARRRALALLAIGLFLASAVPIAAVGPSHSTGTAPARGLPPLFSSASTGSVAAPSGGATVASSPSSNCPGAVPTWNSKNFFCDVVMSFSVLGQSAPADIPLVPTVGAVSEWATGFYVNVTTNVAILSASVYMWGTSWSGAPLTGWNPLNWNQSQDQRPMVICSNVHSGCPTRNPDQASYYVDDWIYFLPGTCLGFWVSATAAGVSPSTINSYQTLNVSEPYPQLGVVAHPTWEVCVQGPFASTNFTDDIHVSTTPSITGKPQFSPNPDQPVQVILNAFNLSGGAPTPIPAAVLIYTLTSGKGSLEVNTTASISFQPSNSTIMSLYTPIPAQPAGTRVQFYIEAYLLVGTGTSATRADVIYSHNFTFNYSAYGLSWPLPKEPLEDNAQLNAGPTTTGLAQTSILTPTPIFLPTGTIVNVSVHEPLENVTISSAEVDFTFNDHGASRSGSVPMAAINLNTTFVHLPGLPPNASLTFRVVAKDGNFNPVFSSNYTYVENGTPVPAPIAGKGFFFVEVYDVFTNRLVPGVGYTLSNTTWYQNASTNPFGFGSVLSYATDQFVELNNGSYFVALTVFGDTIDRTITLTGSMPFTVVFYVSSGPVPLATSQPTPMIFEFSGVIGLLAAFFCYFPLMAWFRERRAKAEAEQRRVTL